MKPLFTAWLNHLLVPIFILTIIIYPSGNISAQVCANPNTFIYGLTGNGNVHRIRVSSAAVNVRMNPAYTGNAPSYSNALGYNNVNGKFYYFKRNSYTAPQEFVSFDAATNTIAYLSNSPAGTSTIINLGAVNNTGTGYYCVDAYGKLFYYNIGSNTWTTIASTLRDQFGTDLTTTFNNHLYGDNAFDGDGNLWIMCASATEYGLYRINGPLPTTNVTTLTAQRVIPPTTPTPNGNSIGGIAFNGSGQIYVSTNGPDNKLFRMENDQTFTFIGTFNIDGVGNDITSCTFPMTILPVTWKKFSAELQNINDAFLSWEIMYEQDIKSYYVEHSTDGKEWKNAGVIQNASSGEIAGKYTFNQKNLMNGKHYYRIRLTYHDNSSTFSEIRMVQVLSHNKIVIGPNPAKDIIYIQPGHINANTRAALKIFDMSGRIVIPTKEGLHRGSNAIDISALSSGTYLIRIIYDNGEIYNQKLLKQ